MNEWPPHRAWSDEKQPPCDGIFLLVGSGQGDSRASQPLMLFLSPPALLAVETPVCKEQFCRDSKRYMENCPPKLSLVSVEGDWRA